MRRIGLAAILIFSLIHAPYSVAEQSPKVFRVGILGNVPLTDPEGVRLWGALTEGLRELGYIEGQNLVIEHRSSEGKYERLPALAADLVRLKVDVIVAPSVQNVVAVEQVTRAIPIVVTSIGDSMTRGIIASLARPGGNVTGLSIMAPEIVGKQLELLKEITPKVSRVSVLWNSSNPGHEPALTQARVAARRLKARDTASDAGHAQTREIRGRICGDD